MWPKLNSPSWTSEDTGLVKSRLISYQPLLQINTKEYTKMRKISFSDKTKKPIKKHFNEFSSVQLPKKELCKWDVNLNLPCSVSLSASGSFDYKRKKTFFLIFIFKWRFVSHHYKFWQYSFIFLIFTVFMKTHTSLYPYDRKKQQLSETRIKDKLFLRLKYITFCLKGTRLSIQAVSTIQAKSVKDITEAEIKTINLSFI